MVGRNLSTLIVVKGPLTSLPSLWMSRFPFQVVPRELLEGMFLLPQGSVFITSFRAQGSSKKEAEANAAMDAWECLLKGGQVKPPEIITRTYSLCVSQFNVKYSKTTI